MGLSHHLPEAFIYLTSVNRVMVIQEYRWGGKMWWNSVDFCILMMIIMAANALSILCS